MQKRIPTLLGLLLLVVALVAGVFFIGQGPGVFAPRATPQTTPKKVKVTNVTDNSFTVSFLTDEKTAGFVKYGTEPSSLKSQSSDDRDQLSGTVGEYQLHHVTVRGLQENTTYHYELGTGSGATFNNNGAPFVIKTAKRSGAPSAAKTIYGSVTNAAGGPADGSIVYVSLSGAGDMSSLVKNSGSWAIPLSNARTPDGEGYANISDTAELNILAQGPQENLSSNLTVAVKDAQPVDAIALAGSNAQQMANQPGQGNDSGSVVRGKPDIDPNSTQSGQVTPPKPTPTSDLPVITPTPSPSPSPSTSPAPSVSPSPSVSPTASPSPSSTPGGLGGLNNNPPGGSNGFNLNNGDAPAGSDTVVSVNAGDGQEVITTQPKIVGKVPSKVLITIEVNSDNKIMTNATSDENGNFEIDLTELQKELEPGEHTVTYSYTDPNTGQDVVKTVTFHVAQSATKQLAQAGDNQNNQNNSENQPFGSGNPFPATSPSPSPSPTPTPATSSTPATRSAMPSTSSGVPVSGSVGTTMALVFGGLFFIISGAWSFWISSQLEERKIS